MLLTHIMKKFSRPAPHVLAILRKRCTIDILHGMVRFPERIIGIKSPCVPCPYPQNIETLVFEQLSLSGVLGM